MKNATILMCMMTLVASADAIAQEPADTSKAKREVMLHDSIKKALDRSGAKLVDHPGGRKELRVNGGHRHAMMMRIGADGTLEVFCATDEAEALDFLSGEDLDEKTR